MNNTASTPQFDQLARINDSLEALTQELETLRSENEQWRQRYAQANAGPRSQPITFNPSIGASQWQIDINDKGDILLMRMHEGKVCESYQRAPRSVGALWLVAISQGFQPPRDLRCFDQPVG